ncbi:PREDICTED: orexin receptor type 2-like isoform X1 [Polistes canadensis]|uniref:orexin receptor type 2-like isoform X1 n=1 Tax=Polistes canadensis TaxID=91411 RepID=UPI000718B862|nr:PREDICTED: orexin receptor type 2-like isoform X1 [Polistes canadensis]XP_014604845.1 PREDICTED: orexin receptor type 2-like isoform X1 [Polistes canadensis]XP_014604846.1 PREDICTED: orexin receptor type 2-like isoform X1 [Polistes canadensis]XP_014604847.1 PREDICTED: orexin receptor type 2-like isoform X1 [Polistes canadensis]XP_014604848.1 PREDICTED: orexin receptor type 2-like isoform X1 [Polistes canadensis]XP_014604849.1 PREDICTED: orexin receptor type 2-like isoform X1 [Polistes canad
MDRLKMFILTLFLFVLPLLTDTTNKSDLYSSTNFMNESNCTNNDCIPDEEYLDIMYNDIFPNFTDWVMITLHSIIFITGLVGNFLVCLAIFRNHSMKTVTNYFIVNLAVADLMVILICLPPSVLWDVTETWFLGWGLCKAIPYLQTVSVSVSVLTLTCISIDRWYAICYPLKFRSTTKWAKIAIVIIWTVSFLFDIPDIIVLHTAPSGSKVKTIIYTQCKSSLSHKDQTLLWAIKLTLFYIVPLIFMTIAYRQIIRVLWRSDIPGHNLSRRSFQMGEIPSTGAGNPEGQLRSRRKAAKMLIAIVVTFAICYFPVHLFSILKYTMLLPSGEWSIKASLFVHWLCYVNSAANPLIYNFMSGKFRRQFKRAFPCFKKHKNRARPTRIANITSFFAARSRATIKSLQTPTNSNNIQRNTEIIPLSGFAINEQPRTNGKSE